MNISALVRKSVGSEMNWWLTTQRFNQYAPISSPDQSILIEYWVVNHRFCSESTSLKKNIHMVLPQTSLRYFLSFGCVWLASLGRPRGTLVSPWQELIEWSQSPSRGDGMHLRSSPSGPLHKQSTGGWPGWVPGMTSKLFERTGGRPGPPREADRSHPMF